MGEAEITAEIVVMAIVMFFATCLLLAPLLSDVKNMYYYLCEYLSNMDIKTRIKTNGEKHLIKREVEICKTWAKESRLDWKEDVYLYTMYEKSRILGSTYYEQIFAYQLDDFVVGTSPMWLEKGKKCDVINFDDAIWFIEMHIKMMNLPEYITKNITMGYGRKNGVQTKGVYCSQNNKILYINGDGNDIIKEIVENYERIRELKKENKPVFNMKLQ